ncbi:Hypothetical_protein [Hexamita inflata]|uniref:Hypothetical_protein n=1 Tax=Hexamita inflata TaxID=28002 RepID=A0AA86P6N1_9EUKA|nr:Hypothetical protein HINF_LOCUS18985 [Hexamita inflata]CAI9967289.1 Hypothetical protein HINF_LOCUS54934 [Hexamita inflata]
MTSDVRKILELPDRPVLQQQQQQKVKQAVYRKLPVHPFAKFKTTFTTFDPPYSEPNQRPYPEYSNLQSDELYREQVAIRQILQRISPIPISEHLYYKYCIDLSVFLSYGRFCEIVDTIFHYHLNFACAADYLQLTVFQVMKQFRFYCVIITENLQKLKTKNIFEASRCVQACQYFLLQITDAKIKDAETKHFDEINEFWANLFQAETTQFLIPQNAKSDQNTIPNTKSNLKQQISGYQIQLKKCSCVQIQPQQYLKSTVIKKELIENIINVDKHLEFYHTGIINLNDFGEDFSVFAKEGHKEIEYNGEQTGCFLLSKVTSK